MNQYKKFKIVDYIRSKGKLPTDQYGQYLNLDDMLVWFGLVNRLDQLEKEYIKREIKKLIDSELFELELRLGY